jgi:hypothetical protein
MGCMAHAGLGSQQVPVGAEETIPVDDIRIGQTITLQALMRSRIALNGAAYSNAVRFSVVA